VPTPKPAHTLPHALISEPLDLRRERPVRSKEEKTAVAAATAEAAAAAAAVIADASRAQEVGRTEAGLAAAVVATSVTTEAGAGIPGGLFYAPSTHRVMPDAFDASKVCGCVGG
jgi:hypothetical protein